MHKRGIIRYANYTVCASVFIHFCMQRKNNENIPIEIRATLNSSRTNMTSCADPGSDFYRARNIISYIVS